LNELKNQHPNVSPPHPSIFAGNFSPKNLLIPILFNDEPYLTPPNLPLVLALAARSAGGAVGGGVNSMQHQIKSV
jgi:hypothetical protein